MYLRYPFASNQSTAVFLLYFFILFSFIGITPFADVSIVDSDYTESGGGNLIRQVIFIFIFFSALHISKKTSNKLNFNAVLPFIFLVGWCVLSTLWAEHTLISIRRAALLVITVSALFLIINILTLEKIIDCLTNSLVLLITVSIVSVPFVNGAVHSSPAMFDSGLEGNWKGIFIHKNHAGPALVVAVFLFFYKFMQNRKWIWIFYICVSLLFLYFTKSKSSLGFLPVSLIFGYLFYWSLNSTIKTKIIFTLFVFTCLFAVTLYKEILTLFLDVIENPEAFTGRATIWDIMVRVIQDNFWFGLGFGSVWRVGENMLVTEYAHGWVEWVFELTEAHNGYLESFISTGFIGFCLVIFVFIIYPFVKSLALCGRSVHPFLILFYSVYTFFIVHNLLETDYLSGTDGEWFLLLSFYFIFHLKFAEIRRYRKFSAD